MNSGIKKLISTLKKRGSSIMAQPRSAVPVTAASILSRLSMLRCIPAVENRAFEYAGDKEINTARGMKLKAF